MARARKIFGFTNAAIIVCLMGAVQGRADFPAEAGPGFEKVIQETKALVIRVGVPEDLQVVVDTNSRTGYDRYSNTLSYNPSVYSHSSVLIHEYGHAVLERALLKSSSLWKAYAEDEPRLAELADTIQRKIRQSEPELPRDEDGVSIDWNQVAKTHPELGNAYRTYAAARKLSRIAQAYSEFFADALAVIEMRDPRTIYDAIVSSGAHRLLPGTLGERSVESRDFCKSWDAPALQVWAEDMVALAGTMDHGEAPYLALGPARHALWMRISGEVNGDQATRQRLIEAVYQVIKTDFEESFPDYVALDHFDPVKFEEHFAERLKHMSGVASPVMNVAR